MDISATVTPKSVAGLPMTERNLNDEMMVI